MNKKKFISSLVDAEQGRRFWWMAATLALVSNVILAFGLITADKDEKTIIIPAGMTEAFTVQGENVSPEYLTQMTRYFSQLLFTYNRDNVGSQFDVILRYVSAESYGPLSNKFAAETQKIRRNDYSSSFYPLSIHVTDGAVYITGELNGYVGSRHVSTKKKTYKFLYRYSGDLRLIGYSEVKPERNQREGMVYREVQKEDEIMVESESASVPSVESSVDVSNKEMQGGRDE